MRDLTAEEIELLKEMPRLSLFTRIQREKEGNAVGFFASYNDEEYLIKFSPRVLGEPMNIKLLDPTMMFLNEVVASRLYRRFAPNISPVNSLLFNDKVNPSSHIYLASQIVDGLQTLSQFTASQDPKVLIECDQAKLDQLREVSGAAEVFTAMFAIGDLGDHCGNLSVVPDGIGGFRFFKIDFGHIHNEAFKLSGATSYRRHLYEHYIHEGSRSNYLDYIRLPLDEFLGVASEHALANRAEIESEIEVEVGKAFNMLQLLGYEPHLITTRKRELRDLASIKRFYVLNQKLVFSYFCQMVEYYQGIAALDIEKRELLCSSPSQWLSVYTHTALAMWCMENESQIAGMHPLEWMASQGYHRDVRKLYEFAIKKNYSHVEIVDLLTRGITDLNAFAEGDKADPFSVSILSIPNVSLEVIQLLHDRGVNFIRRAEFLFPPILISAQMNSVALYKKLIEFGADPRELSDDGENVATIAAGAGAIDILAEINDAAIYNNKNAQGKSAIQIAISARNKQAFQVLYEKPDIDLSDLDLDIIAGYSMLDEGTINRLHKDGKYPFSLEQKMIYITTAAYHKREGVDDLEVIRRYAEELVRDGRYGERLQEIRIHHQTPAPIKEIILRAQISPLSPSDSLGRG